VTIRTVFLDAGGVLVCPNWTRISGALARQGVTVGPDVLARADPHARRQLDRGATLSATDANGIPRPPTNDSERGWLYFNLVLTAAGVPVSAATDAALRELHLYHQRSNLWEQLYDDVLPALQALRDAALRLVVVSNANGTLCAHFDRLGLTGLVDCVLDSQDFGVEKPDPRLFEIALERSGADRETTIHVGDLYHVDVLGARAAGLEAVLFDRADLYDDVDCLRVRTFDELIAIVCGVGR
jgi:putative hydrolase of the HAD superfamily